MKIPVKFVSPLSKSEINELESIEKHSSKRRIRQRAQAILLSSKKVSIDNIAEICHAGRNTVSRWIDNWELNSFESLEDKERPGAPPILTPEEKELVIELAKEHSRSISKIIAWVFEKTGKRISNSTIKRIFKAAGLCWKRIKKIVKDKRNRLEFDTASLEIDELSTQHKNGEIELWFFDESGFSGQSSVPYAWQPIGHTIEVPSHQTKRLNVLGFLTPDNQFESWCFEGSVNTDVVIAVFDEFTNRNSSTKRVVIIDNAPIHTSYDFIANLDEWEKKGVFIKTLPTYCPELNLIEILWHFIKYLWLPFSAFISYNVLVKEVENILAQIGNEYTIDFAS